MLAFENVSGIESTWLSVTAACSMRVERPQRTSGRRVMSDDVVRGRSEACSGGRCGRRRDQVGQITWCFAVQSTVNGRKQADFFFNFSREFG